MTHFTHAGKNVYANPQPLGKPITKLAAEIYTVAYNEMTGQYYLIEKELSFKLPPKLFGDTLERSAKAISTYDSRTQSTGIALTGFKGAGKSVTCKLICNDMLTKGIPVVLINTAYSGEAFNNFVESLGEIVMFFDEFEKVYADEEGRQDKLLTLFDGQSQVKRMYILTSNDKSQINQFMWDRPGRLYYHYEYDGLDSATISEFCEYAKLSSTQTSQVLDLSRSVNEISFDMLNGLVEEMLRYTLTASAAATDLNITVNDYTTLVLTPTRIEHKQSGAVLRAHKATYDRSDYLDVYATDASIPASDVTWYKENTTDFHDGELSSDDAAKWRVISNATCSIRISNSTLVMSNDDTVVYDNGSYVASFIVSEKVYDYSNFTTGY